MEAQTAGDQDVVPFRMYSLTSMDLFTLDNNSNHVEASTILDVHSWPPNPYLLYDSKLQEVSDLD